MAAEQLYPTDLTDEQLAVLEPLHLPPKPGGRPRTLDMRPVMNALLSIDRMGCQWRMLLRKYPNRKTVSWYFTRWQEDGTWERLTDALRRQLRRTLGCDPEPSAAILDSQSVQTTKRGASAATMPASR